jgi:hypothetical protein
MGKGRFETPRSAWQSSKVCQKPEGSTSVKEQSPVGQNQVLMSKSKALLGKTKCWCFRASECAMTQVSQIPRREDPAPQKLKI